MSREWDAATYDRVANPHVKWGSGILEHLDATGVATVVDAGCGTGRVTELVLERVPGAHVTAVDGSAQMVEQAKARLAPAIGAGRVDVVHADLTEPLLGKLPGGQPVDAVVSTATFHWITDHDRLFANLAEVVRPGGQLVAQCGGAGNLASVYEAMRQAGEPWIGPKYYAGAAETARRLEACGFTDVRTWLHDEPTPFDSIEALEEFIGAIVLGAHLERLPESERAPFVHAVASRLPKPELDYVRLNIVARRA